MLQGTMFNTQTDIKYRPDIDGMRAVAVLSVVFYHAFPNILPGGFIGVDIFFVISGFLISGIIFKGLANENFSFINFYARRIKRIFPALLTVLTTVYIFGWFSLYADEFSQLGKHIAGGAAFLSNILLLKESGYFDTSAQVKPLLHLWSLGVEEQFYLLWPMILWAAWKLRINVFFVTIILLLASFYMNIRMANGNPEVIFYSPHTRFWEMMAGAALSYVVGIKKIRLPCLAANAASFLAAILVIYGIMTIDAQDIFPGWLALIPVVASVMLIAAGEGGSAAFFNKHILSSRVFVFIGLISFPLYLWHWPFLSFGRIIAGGEPSIEFRLLAISGAFIAAIITWVFIEKPIRFRVSLGIFRQPALITGMVFICIAGLLTFKKTGFPERAMVKHYQAISSQFTGPIWHFTNNDICLNRYDFPEAKTYKWWFCITNKDASPNILLLGDSFANHLYPGLQKLPAFQEKTILSIGTCDSALAIRQIFTEPTTRNPCEGYRAKHQMDLIESIILSSKNLEYVIISGGVLDNLDRSNGAEMLSDPDSTYIASFKEIISLIERAGARAIVFTPRLRLPYDIKKCFTRRFFRTQEETCTVPAERRDVLLRNFSPLVEQVKSSNPKTIFYDQNDFICDNDRCSFIIDGMPVFRDEYDHYSEYASIKLAESFAAWAAIHAPEIMHNASSIHAPPASNPTNHQ